MTNPGGRVRTSFLVTRTIGSKMLSYETSLISDRLCQQFYRFYAKSFFKATLNESCSNDAFFLICFARCFVQSYLFLYIYIKVFVVRTYMQIKICLPTNACTLPLYLLTFLSFVCTATNWILIISSL